MTRRGAFLLLCGLIWAFIGIGILTVEPSPVQRSGLSPLLQVVDYPALAVPWLAAGALAGAAGLWRVPWLDRWAFYALIVPSMAWAASYVVTSARVPSLRFVLAALVYAALSGMVLIVSAGVEGPATRRERA